MPTILDDLRLALRRLRRSPGFTALAVASLALAIGANTVVFGLVDAALFAPLPLPHAERIVRLWEERPARGWWRFGVSAPAFADGRVQAGALASVAAYMHRSVNMAGAERPERARLVEATSDLFAVLAVTPRLGRPFTREEEAPGRDTVVLLVFDFWRAAFGSDPQVLGRTVALDGIPHVVIGVLSPEVAAFDDAQLWRPLALGVDTRRGARWLEVAGRLRPGVEMAAARAELAAIARRHESEYPDTNTGWIATVVPLKEARAGSARPLLIAMWGAAGLVLLVACANVAALMLARAAEREGEFAVRAALGAGPGRLARLLAVEGLVLAAIGGAAGLRARRILVVAELAMAVALVSATGLLVRSVVRLLDVDLGFDPAGTLALRVAPPQSRPAAGQSESDFARVYFAERDRMTAFYGRLLEDVEQVRGVVAAGAVNRLPLTGDWWSIGDSVPGRPRRRRAAGHLRALRPGGLRPLPGLGHGPRGARKRAARRSGRSRARAGRRRRSEPAGLRGAHR